MPGRNSRSFSYTACSSPAPLTPSRTLCNGLPRPSSFSYPSSLELEEEIVTLEIEILRLERYLLSLYRTAFLEQLPSLANSPSNHSQYKTKSRPSPVANVKVPHKCNKLGFEHHDQPSPANDLSISGSCSSFSSFSKETYAKEKRSYSSNHRSLADHFGASLVDDNIYTPDRLSEEIFRCISSVYCKLANAPHGQSAWSATPSSSFSSSTIFSSKNPHDNWSPCNEELAASNQLKGMRVASDLLADTTEILRIHVDGDSFNYATQMLQSLRSMVQKLETVDPRRLKREEKLAFWINIHNALVMHAYLAYGTQNRADHSTVLKASYNVGGHCIDAYMIQSSILGIRPHVSTPRLQTLFSPGKKYKRASVKHEYALEYPEPLVHFAICSGAYSDPVVRIYRAENIFHDLKIAKEEYIRASVCIKKDRVILPKILYYFAKDMSLDEHEIWGMVSECIPEETRKDCVKRWTDKGIHWSAQCSMFRYVIHGGLAKER